VSGICWSTSS